MINVHGIRRNVKNVVRNYTDAQVKVREATSNDPWGPSSTLMSEIADLTYNVVAFTEIMQMIWKRLNDHGKNWRHVYKALVLLEYMIKTGSEKVAQQCKENIFAIQTLKDFQYIEDNKDQGINVREKSKQLVVLLKDDERLRNERARALKAKERFAQSSSHVGSEPPERETSSGGYTDGIHSPTGAASPKELESTRPQTAGEEELQLQLALAMSKEEAEMEERLRRNDDLRLQMAISESQVKTEELKRSTREPTGAQAASSSLDDLLGLNLGSQTSPSGEQRQLTLDPWGMPIQPSPMPPVQSPDPWTQHANRLPPSSDPWSTGRPVSTPPRPMTSSSSSNDPWSPSNAVSDIWSPGGRTGPTSSASMDFLCGTGGQTNGLTDDFDLLSQRSGTQSIGNQRGSPNPFDLDPLENSLENTDTQPDNNNSSEAGVKAARKTPETFLGANSNLVNLDALVSSKSLATVGATNPFALTTTTTTTTTAAASNTAAVYNPFQAAKPPPPSINQLRAQTQFVGGFTTQQQSLVSTHDVNNIMQPINTAYTTSPTSNPFL